MATPASRTLTPRAPEKGVFPLDHFGECKQARGRSSGCQEPADVAILARRT